MANIQKLKEVLLNDSSVLRDVVRELNSWDGSFENFDVWENDEDFFNTYFDGRPMEAVRAAHYGDYNYTDDYVRFNGYGNLESLDEYQLVQEMEGSIDDIISTLEDEWTHLSLDPDLEELLEEEEAECDDCGEEMSPDDYEANCGLCDECKAALDEEEEEEEETCEFCGEELHGDGLCPDCDAE